MGGFVLAMLTLIGLLPEAHSTGQILMGSTDILHTTPHQRRNGGGPTHWQWYFKT
ncbi:MAG: hypothetical protein ACSLEN_03940 [Candidatus Malihini olakiniferum]